MVEGTQRIGRDVVKTSKGYRLVSTVKLPLKRYAFETMVFKCNRFGDISSGAELDSGRYDSKQEAKKGHEEMVKKWKSR